MSREGHLLADGECGGSGHAQGIQCRADLRLDAVTGAGLITSSTAWPPLTHWSTSEARNFHSRPSLWAGIFLRVIHLEIVSGLTPRCAAISSTDSQRSCIEIFPALRPEMVEQANLQMGTRVYRNCPERPSKIHLNRFQTNRNFPRQR